jgi:hypothetical protein
MQMWAGVYVKVCVASLLTRDSNQQPTYFSFWTI